MNTKIFSWSEMYEDYNVRMKMISIAVESLLYNDGNWEWDFELKLV